ncbi:39S ribosomal protein L19, mitochondrial [Lamellibrachia satsuma]|nr:39S ribosomal protein L19, mitochondrial [Lamellibrachia satsuma]
MAVNVCSKVVPALKFMQNRAVVVPCRFSNTVATKVVERHRKSNLASHTKEEAEVKDETQLTAPRDYKFVYPEFLPDPTWWKRDRICEKLEREDMIRRRNAIEIPEFYVGTIMAVESSDKHAPGKKNRFVGICIQRSGHGLRAQFTLRNVIDGQGVEVQYDLYNPTIIKLEVLKLEKRLDDELFYLRDAPQEYSTVPFDMEPLVLPPGVSVPVNTMKVKLGPRPWHERWERQELRGLEDLGLEERFYIKAAKVAKPWLKHDLMREYRETIDEDETAEIMTDVYGKMQGVEAQQKQRRRQRPASVK